MTAPSSSSLAYLTSTSASQGTENYFVGWNYGGVSNSVSWTNPTGTVAIDAVGGTNTSSTTSGFYTSSLPTSSTLSAVGDPSSPSFSAQLFIENTVETTSTTISNTTGIPQKITENQNWYNSTLSASFSPPSGWINGGSVDGKTWASTFASYTVQHILSVGQNDTSSIPPVDIMQVSGYSTTSFNPPTLYESLSGSPSTTENSAFTLTWNIDEFINYQPNTPSLTTTFTNSGSTINAVAITSEQITGEKENVVINWGDGTPTTNLNNVNFGTQPTQSHTYTGNYYGTFTQTYNPSVTVTNLPNGNPSGNTVQTNSASTSYTFGMQVNPTTPYSIVLTGQYLWLNITTTNVALTATSATVSLNNLPYVQATLAYTSGNTYDYKYTSSLIGTTGITADWKVDPTSLVDTISVQYATKTVPTIDSPSVTALFSNSYTGSYPLSISNPPPR